ncbi:MAG: transketolase [Sphaerochaetaceae bacterium]
MSHKYEEIARKANDMRLEVVQMIHDAGDGHPGPSMSCIDILASLYFGVMNIDSKRPLWEDRDRFILSKGHACPALYVTLANKDYFSKNEYSSLRALHGSLQGHPTMQKTPGLDMTSGSLGNGLGIACGMAKAAKYLKKSYYTYAVLGDGELQEGSVWEAALFAKKHQLDNLIIFVDKNGWQSGGSVFECSGLTEIREKWDSFGWHVQEIDGHNVEHILNAVSTAKSVNNLPSVIIANTIKGKGLPFMEDDNSWHKKVPTEEQVERAIKILGRSK